MRRLALVGVVVASLVLSTVHWIGLLVGGIAVGLFARTWSRALASGAGFGALAWLAFAASLANSGRLAAYLDSGQLLYVSVAIPLALAVVGALAHGLKSAERTA